MDRAIVHDPLATRFESTAVRLHPSETLILRDARGTLVRVEAGSVWLTQDDDPHDFVMRTGETFPIQRNGATVVQAIGSAWVTIAAPDHAPARIGDGTPRRARRHTFARHALAVWLRLARIGMPAARRRRFVPYI
jgi:hypothetical protein